MSEPSWAGRLSPRLRLIVEMLTPCERLADIGCDHALVALAAVARGVAARAWGVDSKPSPLLEARRTIDAAGETRVELREGAGFEPLGDVLPDAVVMAGVGARTMVKTFEDRPEVLQGVRQLVLQPLSEHALVRKWLRDAGFHLVREEVVNEKSRWLPVMRFERPATPGPDPVYEHADFLPEELLVIGPWLARGLDAGARAYLAHEILRRTGEDEAAGRPPGPIARAFMRARDASATMPPSPPEPGGP